MSVAAVLISGLASLPAAAAPSLVSTALAKARQAMLEAQYDLARAILAEAIRTQPTPCDRARLEVSRARVDSQEAFFRGGRDGFPTAETALTAARACGDARVVADALDTAGQAHYSRRLKGTEADFTEARQLFDEAFQRRRNANAPPDEIAESLFHRGLVHEQQAELAPAEGSYREALTYALQATNDVLLSYLYRHLASFERPTRGLSGELDFHRRSLDLRDKTGFRGGAVFARIAIGDTLTEMKRNEEAVSEWQTALDDAQRAGVRRGVLQASRLLAEAHSRKGELDAAHAAYALARQSALELGDEATANEIQRAMDARQPAIPAR